MASSHDGAAFLTNVFVATSLKRAAARERQVITQAGTWPPTARPQPGPRGMGSARPGGTR